MCCVGDEVEGVMESLGPSIWAGFKRSMDTVS